MDLNKIFFLPLLASSHGHEIDMLIYLVHLLMLVLFVGWAIFFVIVLFKFRRKKNPKANYKGVESHISSAVEIGVVVVEAVLLIGFSIPFWAKNVNALPNMENTLEIRIVAEQFAWNIHYPGLDGVFGNTNIEFFDKQNNTLGIDPNDPHGKDDIVNINRLHVPIGKTILAHLTAKDVMHSFFLPEMRVKQDIIPGMSIPTWFTPTRTNRLVHQDLEGTVDDVNTLWDHLVEKKYIQEDGYLSNTFRLLTKYQDLDIDPKYNDQKRKIFLALQKGNWQIACAQLCGLGHYYMRGFLTVHSQEDFKTWYESQATAGGGGDDEFDDFWN